MTSAPRSCQTVKALPLPLFETKGGGCVRVPNALDRVRREEFSGCGPLPGSQARERLGAQQLDVARTHLDPARAPEGAQ